MKLVVGLGNPGREYERTRHNIGFEVVDELAARIGAEFRRSLRFAAHLADGRVAADAILIAKPTTYMNASGVAVGALAGRKGIQPVDVLVVVDDVDIELGRLRIRAKGSAGGHNGLKSVIAALGTDEFVRVRVGVGRPDGGGEMVDHVLSRFLPGEKELAGQMVKRAADAVETWWRDGLVKAMNSFNG